MINKKLEDILSSIKKKKEPIAEKVNNTGEEKTSNMNKLQRVEDVRGVITLNEEENKSLGLVNKLKANSLRSKKQLEAQEVVFNTQIEKLKHQAEATERQSKAYWDAKSVDFTEGLKTYAQQNMQLLENSRLENKSKAIQDAYLIAHEKMNEIIEGILPDSMKEELVMKIIEARDKTVVRIEEDTIAKQYELGPKE